MELVECFKATDGKLFPDECSCKEHELRLSLSELFIRSGYVRERIPDQKTVNHIINIIITLKKEIIQLLGFEQIDEDQNDKE